MAIVRCPGCRVELEVADRLLAEPVSCGACGTVFDPAADRRPVARRVEADDYEDERPRRRRRRDDEYDDDDWEPRPDAHPAYLPGLFGAVACLLGLVVLIVDMVLIVAMPQLVQNNPFFKGGPVPPLWVLIAPRVLACLWMLVVLAASFRMMSGRNYTVAQIGMVMHLFPCTWFCYPLGLAAGIWGLVVLSRPEVRAGFAANDRAARGDDVGEDDDRLR